MLRYERKYLVPNHMLADLRNRFSGFVRPDIVASANGNGIPQYTVRSIYFDSPDLLYYNEKHDGLMKRRKLRVRGYNKNRTNEKVVLEVKRKTGNRISKNRATVSYNHLEQLLSTGLLDTYIEEGFGQSREDALNDARRFFFHLKLKPMLPTTLVSYEREAYHGKLNHGNRITFDKNIRSKNNPRLSELYSEEGMRYLFKSHFIMEIKYFQDKMPSWAKSIVHEFKLRNEALSKYVIGYDVNKTFAHI
jgi:hypothetical protein